MKHLILFISAILTGFFACAQHSPYFYKSYKDDGITNDMHAKYLRTFGFYLGDVNENLNELREKEDGKNFKAEYNFGFTAYFEHSVKYYYDKYLADPKKNKADWDYSELYKEEDNSNSLDDKPSAAVGFLVFEMKVDGNDAASFIVLMTKNSMEKTTKFSNKIWELYQFRPPEKPKYDKNRPVIRNDYNDNTYYPLMYYMRDHGTAGKHKVEYKVYPAKINCKKTSDKSDEVICKGEFNFSITGEIIEELKKECKTKYKPDTQVYTLGGDGFYMF